MSLRSDVPLCTLLRPNFRNSSTYSEPKSGLYLCFAEIHWFGFCWCKMMQIKRSDPLRDLVRYLEQQIILLTGLTSKPPSTSESWLDDNATKFISLIYYGTAYSIALHINKI